MLLTNLASSVAVVLAFGMPGAVAGPSTHVGSCNIRTSKQPFSRDMHRRALSNSSDNYEAPRLMARNCEGLASRPSHGLQSHLEIRDTGIGADRLESLTAKDSSTEKSPRLHTRAPTRKPPRPHFERMEEAVRDMKTGPNFTADSWGDPVLHKQFVTDSHGHKIKVGYYYPDQELMATSDNGLPAYLNPRYKLITEDHKEMWHVPKAGSSRVQGNGKSHHGENSGAKGHRHTRSSGGRSGSRRHRHAKPPGRPPRPHGKSNSDW